MEEAKCRQVEEEVCELVQEEVCTEVIPEYGAGDSSAECTEVFDTVVEDLCTTVNIDTCNDITETICEVMRLFICWRHSQVLRQSCRSYVVMCVSLASSWARLRQPCVRCRKSCVIDANHYILTSSLATGVAGM